MFKLFHSSTSYLVVLLVLFTLINALVKLKTKDSYRKNDYYISLAATFLAVIQLILGAGSYYFSTYYQTLREVGFKIVMKDSTLRMYILEHPLMMFMGIAILVFGFYKHKISKDDNAKFRIIAKYYLIALIFILSRIPWEQWFKSL